MNPRMILCDYCGAPFVPEHSRWLCPVCRNKASCCEGEPQPEPSWPRCFDVAIADAAVDDDGTFRWDRECP